MFDINALYEAGSVAEAVRLRVEHPGAKIIAGGSDMLIKIREGKLAGTELISIFGLDCLRGVELGGGGELLIGPLTSFSHIARHPLIQSHIRALGEAVDQVGGPQIRNIGTIGGNVCNGVTSADSAATLLAYDAVMELTGPEGVRLVPDGEFYLGAGRADIRPGELLTKIIIPLSAYEGYEGSCFKYSMRRAMDIATISCSVNVRLSGDRKRLSDLRCAFGVAGPVPMRAPGAEAALRGAAVSEDSVRAFALAVAGDIHPRDSWRASGDFRRHMASEIAGRCLREAIIRAGGEL